mmetsp:Transcript_18403/g.37722  ORF Transcript_18403/g.37722 Transcript_18403/m.37722 type:complete len:103 (-) Transcript_18403:1283-1591(-)
MVSEIEHVYDVLRRWLRAIIEVRKYNRTIIVQTFFYANSDRSISGSKQVPSCDVFVACSNLPPCMVFQIKAWISRIFQHGFHHLDGVLQDSFARQQLFHTHR